MQKNPLNRLKTLFMPIPQINISDYTYDLPDARIASYPAEHRDESRLLIYNKGIISESGFSALDSYLPENSLMVFNNTKVIPARLLFRRQSGAFIEVFCLEPHNPEDYAVSFASTSTCIWKTIVGNRKKWKGEPISLYIPEEGNHEIEACHLTAILEGEYENGFLVRFTWEGGEPFSSIIEKCGIIPIPPYLNRDSEAIDISRYQTTYAKIRGSVAAPTAGLHFTPEVMEKIRNKGIVMDNLCLHVGAGTFLPVKSESISGHTMHSEPFSISRNLLDNLYVSIDNKDIIAVGTTSVRTLESLYYLGQECALAGAGKWIPSPVGQWIPYDRTASVPVKDAIAALIEYMDINSTDRITARTRIIIVPSYKYRIVSKLITNFHQPQSTLLLLIAAFIGEDWRKVYSYAMDNGFRFLSYGDSSLLMP